LEIYCKTAGAISDGLLIGKLPNQASISDREGQLLSCSTAEQYLEHFLVQAEGNYLKKLDYFTDLDISKTESYKKYSLQKESPVSLLDRDQLPNTKKGYRGIHALYLYCSSSRFGVLFAIYKEDIGLASVNYLYWGIPKV
jgi:hypothetical protein